MGAPRRLPALLSDRPRLARLNRQLALAVASLVVMFAAFYVYDRYLTFSAATEPAPDEAVRANDAAAWAKETLRVDTTDADALDLLGRSEEGRGDAAAAGHAYRRAVAFDPNFRDAFAGLSRVATALPDHDRRLGV